MRNSKLFILISLILISSLIFVGCGKKSNISQDKKAEIENQVEIEETEDIKDDENTQKVELDDKGDMVKEDKKDVEESVDLEDKDTAESNDTNNTNGIHDTTDTPDTDDTKETSSTTPVEDKKPTVTITIIGPEDVGTILDITEVELEEGDTVFDILKQVVKDNSIQMEYKGRKSSVYIRGIHNLYEFDKGPESGWVYRVKGEISQVGCGAHKLNDGDKIEWLYTTELGREFDTKGGGE